MEIALCSGPPNRFLVEHEGLVATISNVPNTLMEQVNRWMEGRPLARMPIDGGNLRVIIGDQPIVRLFSRKKNGPATGPRCEVVYRLRDDMQL